MRSSRRYWVLGLTSAAALAYLIYGGVRSAAVYYVTVSEFHQKVDGQRVIEARVAGRVVPGSIRWVEPGRRVEFVMAEGGRRLAVRYQGTFPDLFKDDAQVVVEGRGQAGRPFDAVVLLAKCPTKYESDERE
jgi:cytochrome c-type biogenesis protein CcmE